MRLIFEGLYSKPVEIFRAIDSLVTSLHLLLCARTLPRCAEHRNAGEIVT
jgi:hypothetical protein